MDAPARHQCLIYEGSPSAQLPKLAEVILEKLSSGARCLYLHSPAMVTALRTYLASSGLDVTHEIQTGDLVLTSDQGHLKDGSFDVQSMLDMLRGAIEQAMADGYKALWASGDMLWEFGSEKNLEKLLEYEFELDKMLQQYPMFSGVCQYHRDTLPPEAVRAGMYTHRSLFINQTLSRMNPFHTAPLVLRNRYRPDGSLIPMTEIINWLRQQESPRE